MKRRLLLVLLSMLCAGTVCAQPYPAKPIRIVVTSFGSGPDLMARLIGRRLTEAWGQQVIVDARVGATGRIAAEHVARSPADGYTLMMVTSQFAIGSALYEKLTFDPIKDFFAGGDARLDTVCAGGASIGAGQIGERVDRTGEGTPWPVAGRHIRRGFSLRAIAAALEVALRRVDH